MRNETRQQYNAYLQRQAQLNGVSSAVEQFDVNPSVQQTLESTMQESSAFLSRINVIGVDQQQGEKIGLGVSGPIASRTDVTNDDRAPTNVADLTGNEYNCKSTEFDTSVPWAQLDAWAKFRDFQLRLRNQVLRRQALDRIMIGFNGTSAATATNIASNDKLQDVNIGWLQQYRDNAADYVVDDNDAADGHISYGQGGDYAHLDALIYDLARTHLDAWYVDDPSIRVLVSRDLMHDKLFPLVEDYDAPTERNAAEIIMSSRRLGGYQALAVPFMPEGTALITSLDNLSLYWQRGTRRRHVIDNPKRNRIEHYDSSNDAYVVEDYGKGVLVENIQAAA